MSTVGLEKASADAITIKNKRDYDDFSIIAIIVGTAILLTISSWTVSPILFLIFFVILVAFFLPLFFKWANRRPKWFTVSNDGVVVSYRKKEYTLSWEQINIRCSAGDGANSYSIDWKGSPAWFPLPISWEVYFLIYEKGEEMGYSMDEGIGLPL